MQILQKGPGPGHAVALPGVLANEKGDITVLKITPYLMTEHLCVDPEFAGFFLRQGIGAIAAAQNRAGCNGKSAGQVIALAAAAVIKNLVPAVLVPNGGEAIHDLPAGLIPWNGRKAAIGLPLQGCGYPIPAVLVVVQARRFLTEVAR